MENSSYSPCINHTQVLALACFSPKFADTFRLGIIFIGFFEFIVGATINAILIVTICCSPILKTPPNFLLINICVNNLFIALATALSQIILLRGSSNMDSYAEMALKFEFFFTILCYIVYWNLFSAVAYYRLRTLRNPKMTLSDRKIIIRTSLVTVWFISVILATGFALLFDQKAYFTSKNCGIFENYLNFSAGQMIVLIFFIANVVICACLIGYSFFSIFKTLYCKRSVKKTRIVPILMARHNYDISTSFALSKQQSDCTYAVNSNIFTISLSDNSIAECELIEREQSYCSNMQLKNYTPSRLNKNTVHKQEANENGKTKHSVPSKGSCDFTDITVGSELHQLQFANHRLALRKQLFGCQQKSSGLTVTTRNSVVMISLFLVTSLPLVIAVLLNLLVPDHQVSIVSFVVISQVIFNLSGTLYPVWYFIFTNKVRRCLSVIAFNIRNKYCMS